MYSYMCSRLENQVSAQNRREFLGAFPAIYLAWFFGERKRVETKSPEVIISPIVPRKYEKYGKEYPGRRSDKLLIQYLSSGQSRFFDIPTRETHSVEVDPFNKNLGLVIEYRGKIAAYINFSSGKTIFTMAPREGRLFSGHGLFHPQTGEIMLSEYKNDLSRRHGYISVRRKSDGQSIKEFESGGGMPHQLAVIKDSFFVCNARSGETFSKTNLSVFNLHDYRRVARLAPSKEEQSKDLWISHLMATSDSEGVLGAVIAKDGKTYPSPYLSFSLKNDNLLYYKETKKFESSESSANFAICRKTNTIAISFLRAGGVAFVDSESFELKHYHAEPQDMGRAVFLRKDGQFIVYLFSGKILSFDSRNLRKRPRSLGPKPQIMSDYFFGSHSAFV